MSAMDPSYSHAAPDDGEVDPAMAEQMRQHAENAADHGAHQALQEAQAAAQAALQREAVEEAQQQQQEEGDAQMMHQAGGGDGVSGGNFDLGEEFGIGSTKNAATNAAGTHFVDPNQRTFLTGVDNASAANLLAQQQQQQQQQFHQQQDQQQQQSHQPLASHSQQLDPNLRMSDEELIGHVEHQMMEYERTAQYLEAEKARQHLESLKKRFMHRRRDDLEKIQAEDVKVFFAMVAQHQENFDRTWSKKTLEHKLRADDLIDSLKWKHEDQQRDLYEALRKKRMPKFSVELLNMRKRQVLLAKSKNYISAEKVKRKADILEAIEIERIREAAKEENQLRFQALLKKQEWDRRQLSAKLKIEKKCLLEAKAQDFLRLKKRLRNAEQELKKTHTRQQLLAEKKILPLYSYNAQDASSDPQQQSQSQQQQSGSTRKVGGGTSRDFSNTRGNVLRNTGMQRMMQQSSSAAAAASQSQSQSQSQSTKPPTSSTTMKSARDLARTGRESTAPSSLTGRAGQSIMQDGVGGRPASRPTREEMKEVY